MKGIILAGGVGSRLQPVTFVVNKSILPVYNKPSIFYSVEMFEKAGITDICIIADYHHVEDFKTLLGNGTDFGVRLEFISDTPYKKGPASAMYYARDYIDRSHVAVVYADGIYDIDIRENVESFKSGSVAFLKEVENPGRFGVYELSDNGDVVSIEEKPEKPKSNYAFTGLSFFDEKLIEYIEMIKPGLKGEYYTTDVHSLYLDSDALNGIVIDGFWQDIGTFDGLLNASNYWQKKIKCD